MTELGINTGFPKREGLKGDVGGKYEWPARGSKIKQPFPEVVKEPQICADLDLRIEKLGLKIDHVYILLRRPGPIAPALEFIRRGSKNKEKVDRGLTADSLDKVERGLTRRIIQIVHLVAEMDIPHTLVSYPRFAADHSYAYGKFQYLLYKHGISGGEYARVAERCVDKDLVAKAYADMPEWCRAMMREAYHYRKRL